MRYLKLGRNFSKNTLDAYYHDLNFLLEYADKNNLVLTEMKLEDLENFSASLHDRGVSARSQARILSGIRSFYRYLVLDDYIKDDPTELLVSPQRSTKNGRAPTSLIRILAKLAANMIFGSILPVARTFFTCSYHSVLLPPTLILSYSCRNRISPSNTMSLS